MFIVFQASTYRETRFDYQRANYEADVWDILLKMADEGADAFTRYLEPTVERWKQLPYAVTEAMESTSLTPSLPSILPPGFNVPRIQAEISRRVQNVVLKKSFPKSKKVVQPRSNWFLGCIKESLIEAQSEASEALTRAQTEAVEAQEHECFPNPTH